MRDAFLSADLTYEMGLEEDLLNDLDGDGEYGDEGEYVEETVDAGDDSHPTAQAEDIVSTTAPLLKRKASDRNEDGMDEDEEKDDVTVKQENFEMLIPQGGVRPADELDAEDVAQMQLKNVKDVSSVARLAGSRVFKEVLQVTIQAERQLCKKQG